MNEAGVEHARRLIAARQYVLRSQWGEVQPTADAENAYLDTHDWDAYGRWFRRIHRMGLIACHYRAAEWRHKAIELAAHELLQELDEATA